MQRVITIAVASLVAAFGFSAAASASHGHHHARGRAGVRVHHRRHRPNRTVNLSTGLAGSPGPESSPQGQSGAQGRPGPQGNSGAPGQPGPQGANGSSTQTPSTSVAVPNPSVQPPDPPAPNPQITIDPSQIVNGTLQGVSGTLDGQTGVDVPVSASVAGIAQTERISLTFEHQLTTPSKCLKATLSDGSAGPGTPGANASASVSDVAANVSGDTVTLTLNQAQTAQVAANSTSLVGISVLC
jgi:hypothetical protein